MVILFFIQNPTGPNQNKNLRSTAQGQPVRFCRFDDSLGHREIEVLKAGRKIEAAFAYHSICYEKELIVWKNRLYPPAP